jgi:bifunctional enzyme CysN/CysC
MIVRKKNLPQIETSLEAIICWMDEQAMTINTPYIMKHTTKYARASITKIVYKIDVDTLHRQQAVTFQLNEIGRVEISTSTPIFFDSYKINHATGSFILIDPLTNNTVAAGMIRDAIRHIEDYADDRTDDSGKSKKSSNVIRRGLNIELTQREKQNGHMACVLWFTGLSGSGKSTIAMELERRLFAKKCNTVLLDGDNIRHGLCSDLGFSSVDRKENIRRAGEVAKIFFEHGSIVLCTFISPFQKDREFVRSLFPQGRFAEIYMSCNLDECRKRDPNGLYKKAQSGLIKDFTGLSSPYEAPATPELIIDTESLPVEKCVDMIEQFLMGRHYQPQ